MAAVLSRCRLLKVPADVEAAGITDMAKDPRFKRDRRKKPYISNVRLEEI